MPGWRDAPLVEMRARPIPGRRASSWRDAPLIEGDEGAPEAKRKWSGQSYIDAATGVAKSLGNTAIGVAEMGARGLPLHPPVNLPLGMLAEYEVNPEEKGAYQAANVAQMLVPGGAVRGTVGTMAKAAAKAIPRVAGMAAVGAGEEYIRGGSPGTGALIGASVGAGIPGVSKLAGPGGLPRKILRAILPESGGAAQGAHTAEELASFASARAEVAAIERAERAAAKTAKADEAARFRAAREETRALETAERHRDKLESSRQAHQRARESASFQSAKTETRALETSERSRPKAAPKPEPKASQSELEAFAKSISAESPNKVTAMATAKRRATLAERAGQHNELMAFGREVAKRNPKLGEKIWLLLDDAGKPVQYLTDAQAGAAKRAGKATTWVKNLWQGRVH